MSKGHEQAIKRRGNPVNRHRKRCSNILIISQIQIKTIMSYCIYMTDKKIRTLNKGKVGRNEEILV